MESTFGDHEVELPRKVASASGDCRDVMMSMSPALRAFVIAVASV